MNSMDKQTPTKPQRSSKKTTSPEEVPSVEEVAPAEPTPSMKRTKIGEPTIGRSPDFVKTVGLGNLTVITANGKRNYT
jgi:hypothetical protein